MDPVFPADGSADMMIHGPAAYFISGQIGVLAILTLLAIIPTLKLLSRTGLSLWWALLLILSMVGFLLIVCIVAFRDWPVHNRRETGA